MADYETPNVLADSEKAWLVEFTETSVFNIEVILKDQVLEAFQKEEQETEAYSTGFAVDTKDEKKLRILTSFRSIEKYEETVVKIHGDFGVASINEALEFGFLCVHVEKNYREGLAEDRTFGTITVLDVDPRNSLVLLEMDVEDVPCKEHHHALKMANHRPPKGQEFLFRAWPCLCANAILWMSISNNLDRDSKNLFRSHSGNMKLTQYSMRWENDETKKDELVHQYYGSPVIDGNGDFFGVHYGVYDWNGYATSLEEVKGFILKHFDLCKFV